MSILVALAKMSGDVAFVGEGYFHGTGNGNRDLYYTSIFGAGYGDGKTYGNGKGSETIEDIRQDELGRCYYMMGCGNGGLDGDGFSLRIWWVG